MKEFDLLKVYPNIKARLVSKNTRTIRNRIIASYKDKEFYDGERNNGYGGYNYDGRWKKIAQNIMKRYKLKPGSKVLQIGCDKGFLIYDLKTLYPTLKDYGVENSKYAISKSPKLIKKNILHSNFTKLPFKKKFFDFVIAIGPVYSLNLSDAIKCLKEIKRIGKGKSFITLGSYENDIEQKLFSYWTLLGSTILSKKDWRYLLKYVKYNGDFKFNTAKTLNLKLQK